MPSKNKPKRLDRQRSSRVARRKRRIVERVLGNTRSRGKRPKDKGATSFLKKLDAPQKSAPKESPEKKQPKNKDASKKKSDE